MWETETTHTDNRDPLSARHIWLSKDPLSFDQLGKLQNPAERKFLLEWIVKKIYENAYRSKNQTPYDEKFIQEKTRTFVAYIESRLGNFDRVYSVSMEHGILRLFDTNWGELLSTNALTLWDNVLKWTPEIKKLEEKIRKETEALREEALTDSLFGWSVLVKYAVISWSIVLGADSALHATAATINGQAHIWNGYQRMSEILLRTPAGTFERVPLAGTEMMKSLGTAIEWSRDILRSRTISILERLGYIFDPITKTATHVAREAYLLASEALENLSFREYRAKYGLTITESEFTEARKMIQASKGSIVKAGYALPSITSLLTGKVLHAVMFPVFFSAFTKRQSWANLAAGLAEWWLFSSGVALWNKVGKMGGIVGKIASPIILWVGFVILGHKGFDEYLWGSQKKWEIFNGTDMYDYRRSVIMHGLNLGAPEATDEINKHRDTSLNWAIPQWNWTEQLWKAGRKIPLTAGTGITPDITFIQSSVHLGVDPADWMWGSLNNRNKDSWNLEVSRYKKELLISVFKLIDQFQKNKPPFFVEDAPDKKTELFSEILNVHILWGTGANFYGAERVQIHTAIVAELWKWNKGQSYQFLREMIENYLSWMYMNELTFANEQNRQTWENQSIEEKSISFVQQIVDPKEKQYFKSLFSRMKAGERLFETDSANMSLGYETYSQEITPSEEHILFLSLLKNRKKILWGPNSESVEIWKVFANLLDLMSDHIVRRDSMNRLSSISWDENGGYWRENEWVKAKMK